MTEARALIDDRSLVVAGGETRQESVYKALEHVATEVVVVHDAARPLVTSALVNAVVAAISEAEGAVAALPVAETLKRVSGGRIDATVDRSNLWVAQTPQAFRTEVLRAAHEEARAGDLSATDDAQLVEQLGGTVVVVEGARSNLKLTRPDDFELAEALLRR
jgi:2-C-methyl-D-erythritol 4-phosphate cytidylyltransferase